MKVISGTIKALSRFLYWISCLSIVSILFLTVLDVTLRRLRTPIDFAFEIVVFLAAIVIGSALPQTSLDKGHVVMEFLTTKLSRQWQKALNIVSRCIGIVTFAILCWNIIRVGNRLRGAGQCSPILHIPEFPVAYWIGVCCFIECLVLVYGLVDDSEGVAS